MKWTRLIILTNIFNDSVLEKNEILIIRDSKETFFVEEESLEIQQISILLWSSQKWTLNFEKWRHCMLKIGPFYAIINSGLFIFERPLWHTCTVGLGGVLSCYVYILESLVIWYYCWAQKFCFTCLLSK